MKSFREKPEGTEEFRSGAGEFCLLRVAGCQVKQYRWLDGGLLLLEDGMSIAQELLKRQKELNDLHNLRMDNLKMMMQVRPIRWWWPRRIWERLFQRQKN